MSEKERPVQASRRGVLSAFAGTGVVAALASVGSNPATAEEVTATATTTDASATGPTDAVSLGTFESGLDDWQADGAIRLSRVARSDRPAAVTEGEYALASSVDGDPAPAISRPVGGIDLATRPHFVADVAPGRVEGTDAPVAFRFRLYRPADLLDGDSDPEPVAASDPVTVRQAAPGRIYWDASDVDSGLLDAVSVLELEWYPADCAPDSDSDCDLDFDPDRDSSGDDFAFHGEVVFDDVRATASRDSVASARLAATFRELQFDHGPYVRTEVTAESETREEGRFVFAGDETEPYRFDILAEDRFSLAIADTEVKLGGGWS
ncbi:hypothetical protein [Halorussus salinisoli]|uniref:hypothetical protein n=1 Tax=Halorussus salinisoli TaxID=2558242 RepID=UPI002A920CAA|nr:hypothetical protein [Halorussus salinisoli]